MRLRSISPGIERIFDTHRFKVPPAQSLKIALVAHLKYPIAQPYSGGLEMHTHLVARKLAARGHDVTLFASCGSDPSMNLVPICEPTGGLSGRREQHIEEAAYREIVARIVADDFDVVHNNSLHPTPLLCAPDLPPMMTVLHTPPFSPLADHVGPQSSARFVAISQSVVDQWRKHIAVTDVVPNGIELDTFAPGALRAAPPRAIWFGRIVPEKGLHLAIEAARVASLPLDIAGPIIDRDYWAKAIAPICNESVRYLGHLDHPALRWRIAQASVALITPRWEEPFGLVAAEALACGTPVAAFRRGALPVVVGDAGVLAAPDDAADLARAARAALRIAPSECRRHAEEALDCMAMIARYEAIYDAMRVQARARVPTAAIAAAAG